ncbi:MAG: translocation/assembly module TamB domain-containing protein [Woeseiaceae bacterium]
MRFLRAFIAAVLLLGLVAAGGWHWLLHTESGANWVWAKAQSASNNSLQMQTLVGDLGSGLTIQGVVFSTDTVAVEVEELRFAADVDLVPLRLQLYEVSIRNVTVQLSDPGEESAATKKELSLEELSLPLLVQVGDSVVTGVTVTRPPTAPSFEIRQVNFAGYWHEEIIIDELIVNWEDSNADLAAELSLQSPYAVNISGKLTNIPVPSEAVEPLDLQLQVAGDLQQVDFDISADNVKFRSSGTGSMSGLSVASLEFANEDVELSGSGELHWTDNWSAEAKLDLARFNLSTVLDAWPSEQPVHGELSLALSKEQLAINESWLAVGNTETTLNVDALIDLERDVAEGELRWRNLRWPPAGGEFPIVSDTGSVSVTGSPDDWRVSGTVTLSSDRFSAGRFQIDGFGDRNQMQATIIDSQILGGRLAGQTSVSWRNERAWSASLMMTDLELAALNDRWPSRVSGNVDAQGTQDLNSLNLNLQDVSGELHTLPMTANGRVQLSGDSFRAQELSVRHSDSRLEIDGDLYSADGMTFDIVIDDAGRYLVDANGFFEAAGSLSLHPDHQFVKINGKGSELGYGELQATSAEIRNRTGEACPLNAEAIVPELRIGDDAFDNVTLTFCGDQQQQALTLDASYDTIDVQVAMAGGITQSAGWQGDLQEFSLAMHEEPLVTLSAPAALSLSNHSASLERACLSGDTSMRLCTATDWAAGTHFNLDAEMADLPLSLINRFISTELLFNQTVNGQVNWSQSVEKGTDGYADINFSAGAITSTTKSDISVPTDPGTFFFKIVDGRALTGSGELPLPNLGGIAAELSIPDIRQGGSTVVDGSVQIELMSSSLLAALFPAIDQARGNFKADLAISGTLSDPHLVGEFSVTDGSLAIRPFGLQLEQINLTSTLFDDGQVELSGDFVSGEGRAELYTRSDYANTGAKGFELELRGQNLTLIDIPDIRARTDVDLRVNYDYKQLELGGSIVIPQARIMATDLAAAQDVESEDVVIVAGELPTDDRKPATESDFNIAGSVEVALGNDVSMDLGIATASLTGSTVFLWQDTLIPIADGRYDLTGSVQAFGQALEITSGGLRFPKIPADNPFVRLRAEREIYGNPQVKTAGILVDGQLRQISVNPYTKPMTTEERALTLLVTGSDFDYEQGVGAIDFGTYIAPRVFVSYGVGLFETENVVRVRYDLKRGFGVTATSGEKESGLDLSYRIER